MAKLQEVFGIRPEPVKSYVRRSTVDDRFEAALEGHQHIVVYGSSKQGKSSLRQTYVPDEDCVIVRCSPRMTIESIYQSVLRQTNVRIETIQTSSQEVGGKLGARIGFKAFIPWFAGAQVGADAEATAKSQTVLTTEFIGYDFADAQAIGELL